MFLGFNWDFLNIYGSLGDYFCLDKKNDDRCRMEKYNIIATEVNYISWVGVYS